jgi:Cu(I)/Ag(I) efflux system membrane fusion protein/cobalt-zinc-cadmium efflux system membrane fusion protein
MDPSEIYDEPGTSRMGMELIPVYEGEQPTGASSVRIEPAVVQNMGVRTVAVERRDLSRQIRTVGEVMYDEERLFGVNARISGWIERLHVNFVGEELEKGDPLLEIYAPDLVTTQEEYLLAKRHLAGLSEAASDDVRDEARRLVDAALIRLRNWNVPEDLIESLDRTGKTRRTVLLRAPATGVVIEKNAVEGDYIMAGSSLFRIADLRSVWVHASFYDHEVPWLAEGQPATMELSYLPGKTYQGRIAYIYPYLREKARDVHVRLVFSNEDLSLKPGMYTNVQLDGLTRKDVLTVPSEAVIRSGEKPLVFVALGDGRFEPRTVRIGVQGGPGNGLVHVLSGLHEGERVVTSAQFMLDSESRLQEAIQKMLAARSDASEENPASSGMDHGDMDATSTPGGSAPSDSADATSAPADPPPSGGESLQ